MKRIFNNPHHGPCPLCRTRSVVVLVKNNDGSVRGIGLLCPYHGTVLLSDERGPKRSDNKTRSNYETQSLAQAR